MDRLSRILRWVFWLALGAVLLAAALLVGWRAVAMPQASGELRLEGVREPLRLLRDRNGVAHVFAATADDAYFGLGFAHGQDRLWQLEMNRRVAAGRLAEVLGPAALGTDTFLRTLGVRRNAERIVDTLDAATRASLQAYADGVNAAAALAAARVWRLPPEYLLLGTRPEPWTPVDSVAWATMMAWDLGSNFGTELLRFVLSERLGSERVNELFDLDPALGLPDYATRYREIGRDAAAALLDLAPPTMGEGVGSNNWVVDGRRSASGKPLLANDPHLSFTAPGTWYLAHLSAPGLEAIGATLPGLPYVVLGRNARIAWGFTNSEPDTQDLYLERLTRGRPGSYDTPDGPREFVVRTEVIRVRGAADVVQTVRETRHGPVISDAMPRASEALSAQRLGERHVLAFQWAALRGDDRTVRAGFALNRAGTWDEFLAAMRDLHSPQQNVVYADVDGNIGFIAAGRVPVRGSENDLKGLVPAPGWQARYDWTGFIPFERLPRVWRPASGVVVTANQRIVDDEYPYFLSAEWTRPYRFDRINDLLSRQLRHDPPSFARIQADTVSLAVRQMLPRILSTGDASGRRAEVQAMLARWDGTMAVDRPEPLIATAWIDRLRRLVFADEVGDPQFEQLERYRGRHAALQRVLSDEARAHWCDDVATPAVETCAEMAARALDQTLEDLARVHGQDPRAWRWGAVHVALHEHRPLSRNALLAPLFDVRYPVPGDAYTINVGRHVPTHASEPFASRHGPGYRGIYDLGDPENSVYIASAGQSGHRLSPHYADLTRRWAAGDYLPMRMERAWIERATVRELHLLPRR